VTKTLFSEDHEYIRIEGTTGTIGISDYAQEQLGDIVFVELPAVGTAFKKGDEIAVVESVKAASEIYAPVDCTVTQANEVLSGDPGQVNSDPMGDGWLIKVSIDGDAAQSGLMDEAAYATHIA
jgi:glycine cleavage system H protein